VFCSILKFCFGHNGNGICDFRFAICDLGRALLRRANPKSHIRESQIPIKNPFPKIANRKSQIANQKCPQSQIANLKSQIP
jgi:hypothetical protein